MEAKARETELSIDKCGTKDEALKVAISAIERYMKASKHVTGNAEKSRIDSKCKALLLKAEEIKQSSAWPLKPPSVFLKVPVSERPLSKLEQLILLEGSRLHGFSFPRWISEPDDSIFETSIYTDPSELKLSEAQIETFAGWKRPHERGDVPSQILKDVEHDEVFMDSTEDIDLVQDIATDCSVVASLCAATARASKGHSKVLATILRPFDSQKQRPSLSKNGKYILRLQFNGCYRKVTIDDRLPASSSTRSLHVVDRNSPALLWPALVEKAYLKVRGGYDFPGSNSGTDLWIMTGWIPEQIFLQSDEIQSELLWKRIYKSFEFGDVMITLGTGKLTIREEADLGLVGEHDYAILDMRESRSQRLLLVKNPWCDGMAWKGPRRKPADEHLEADTWTEDLRESLETATGNSRTKLGTFWMALEDVIQNYESLYLNWNPGLFRYRQDLHFSWTIPHVKASGTFTQNPQYVVHSTRGESIWVLLSRHFTTEEHDIAQRSGSQSAISNALGFISLYVFDASGHRVYLSDGALHRGAYVDSPQTLARFDLPANTPYTVVAAQQNLPLPKYSFSFSFFSRSPLTIHSAPESLTFSTSHSGSWTTRTAGGNASAPSYPSNPQFSIAIHEHTDVMLVLEADREDIAVHVTMIWAKGERVTIINSRDIVGGSGDYRRGCALAELRNIAPGEYTIVCSTFQAGEIGNFVLGVKSSSRCEIRPVLSETAGRLETRLPTLIFPEGIDRMLAPVTVTRLTRLKFVARVGTGAGRPIPLKSRPSLRISLERGQGPNKTLLSSSSGGEFSDAPAGVRTADINVAIDMMRMGGIWVVVERLGGRLGLDDVLVEALSDLQISVGAWGTGDG